MKTLPPLVRDADERVTVDQLVRAVRDLQLVVSGQLGEDNVRRLGPRGPGGYVHGAALIPGTVPADRMEPRPDITKQGYNAALYTNPTVGAATTTTTTWAALVSPNQSFVVSRDGLLWVSCAIDLTGAVAASVVGLRLVLDGGTYLPSTTGRTFSMDLLAQHIEVSVSGLVPVGRGRHTLTALEWQRTSGLGTPTTDDACECQIAAMLVGV